MHPTPPSASLAGDGPPRTDAAQLAKAWRLVSELSHPGTRHIIDATMENLHGVFVARGIRAARIPGLRRAVRKDLRQVWTDGIVIPLARSRDESSRALLRAIPQAFDPADHAAVTAAMRRIVHWIPANGAETLAHAERAFSFLACLPIILQASAELDAFAFTVDPDTQRAADEATGSIEAERADQAAVARRRLKAALAKGLQPLVDEAAETVYRTPLGVLVEPGLRHAAAVLRAPPARGARRIDRDGPAWRRRLADALVRDIVDGGIGPALDRLLRRHLGLKVAQASYVAGRGLDGEVRLEVARAGIELVLSAGFDIEAGRFERTVSIAGSDGSLERLADAGVDAVLDAAIPQELDTAAHRVLRRLLARDALPDIPSGVSGCGALIVGDLGARPLRKEFLEWLVGVADEEGAGLKIAPADDAPLTASLAELSFSWREGRTQPFMSRDPATPAPTCGLR